MVVRTSSHSPIFFTHFFRVYRSHGIHMYHSLRSITLPQNLLGERLYRTALALSSSCPDVHPPPLIAVCNLSSPSDKGEPVDETGKSPTIGRPSDFPNEQKEHLQKLVPTYLLLPSKRKNALKKAFFDTAVTEFVVKFSDELSKEEPYNLKELGFVSHFHYCLCSSL